MHEYLVVADEVRDALDSGQAVVALESTVISHGLVKTRCCCAVCNAIRKSLKSGTNRGEP